MKHKEIVLGIMIATAFILGTMVDLYNTNKELQEVKTSNAIIEATQSTNTRYAYQDISNLHEQDVKGDCIRDVRDYQSIWIDVDVECVNEGYVTFTLAKGDRK